MDYIRNPTRKSTYMIDDFALYLYDFILHLINFVQILKNLNLKKSYISANTVKTDWRYQNYLFFPCDIHAYMCIVICEKVCAI